MVVLSVVDLLHALVQLFYNTCVGLASFRVSVDVLSATSEDLTHQKKPQLNDGPNATPLSKLVTARTLQK